MSSHSRIPGTPVSLAARDVAFSNDSRGTYSITPTMSNQAFGLGAANIDQHADNEVPGSAQLHNHHLQEAKAWVEKEIAAHKDAETAQREMSLRDREAIVARREAAVKQREDAARKNEIAAKVILQREEDVAEREKAMDVFEKWLAVEEARAGVAIGLRASSDNDTDGPDTTTAAGADCLAELEDTSIKVHISTEAIKKKDSVIVDEEDPFPGFSWTSQCNNSYAPPNDFVGRSDSRPASPPILPQSIIPANILDNDISIDGSPQVALQPGATHLPRRVKFDLEKPLPLLPGIANKKRAKHVYPRSPIPSPIPDSRVRLTLPITFSPSTEFLTLSDVESEIFPNSTGLSDGIRRNHASSTLGELSVASQKKRSSSLPEKTLKRMGSFADLKKGVRHGP